MILQLHGSCLFQSSSANTTQETLHEEDAESLELEEENNFDILVYNLADVRVNNEGRMDPRIHKLYIRM